MGLIQKGFIVAAVLSSVGCSDGTDRIARNVATALGDLGLRDARFRDAGSAGDAIRISGVSGKDAKGRPVTVDEILARGFRSSADGWSAREVVATRVTAPDLTADTVTLVGPSTLGSGRLLAAGLSATGVGATLHGIAVRAPALEGALSGDGGGDLAFRDVAAAGDTWEGRVHVGPGPSGVTVVSVGPATSRRGTLQASAVLSGADPAAVTAWLFAPTGGRVPGDLVKADVRGALSSLPAWLQVPDPSRFADPRMRLLAGMLAGNVGDKGIRGEVLLRPRPGTKAASVATDALAPDAAASLGVEVDPTSLDPEVARALADAPVPAAAPVPGPTR